MDVEIVQVVNCGINAVDCTVILKHITIAGIVARNLNIAFFAIGQCLSDRRLV